MCKKFFCLVAVILVSLATVNGGQRKDSLSVNLSTPYHTIQTHIQNLSDDNYHPEIAALTLNAEDLTQEEAAELAIKLKQIYTGRGYYIDLEEISKDADYYDSLNNEAKFYPFSDDKDIYLRKVGDKWLYSKKTISLIPQKHKALFPFGTDVLLDVLQKYSHNKLLGLYYWQYIAILILILFSFIAHKIFTFLLGEIFFRIIYKSTKGVISLDILKPVARPASLFLITFIIGLFIPILQLPGLSTKYVNLLIKGLVPFFGMLIAYRLVDLLGYYFERLAQKSKSTLDDQLVPLVRKSLKIFVVVIGVLFILQNLDFNVTALLAGISIGGLAFALAAQDTIKNLFGSLMIFLDKPFQVGDWVTSGEIDGTVEEVGFRSTRVRTFRNSLVYVPNGKLADATIDNHGLRKFRRFSTRIRINYDTPPELINQFIEGLRKIVEEHPHTRKDFYHVYLNEFGVSALEIMFYIFFIAPDWGKELTYRHEIIFQIIELANKLGVRFALPAQALHLERVHDKEFLNADFSMTAEELKNKISTINQQKGISMEPAKE
ncbi:MAG TPA: mechanosensitive ion channel domain-containing protein [Cytophagaceae bacterium]